METNNEQTTESDIDVSLEGYIERIMNAPGNARRLADQIFKLAREGDKEHLKIINQIMENAKYKAEKKRIVTDEQLTNIILAAADRLRKGGAGA